MKELYYITTAIAYTSSIPHIGNIYEIVLADAIARYKRMTGYDVYFQTGTDEHGQKIQQKAQAANLTPQVFVDQIANKIKSIFDNMNISYDKFIRTTDHDHELIVQDIFTKLFKQNDIYKGKYTGLYCVPCEAFFTDTQAPDKICPDCGRPLEFAEEEAYFLRLEKYQDRLVKHIKDNKGFIQPESRKNEMLNNFLKEKLPDLCVSRTSFDWGIKVPFDQKHVVYVWLDALSNYITGLGYNVNGKHGEMFNKYWPANVHLIGKDILRFHTIYWPIMLMALDLELPKQVFGHPWILVGQGKMSKSKGNVLYPDELIKHYGVDAVRYYVLHEIPFAQDGLLTHELMIERINGDLANTLGNLVNRTVAMIIKYNQGFVKNDEVFSEFDEDLIMTNAKTVFEVEKSMSELKISDALEHIIKLARRANKYIDETEPWVLGKSIENAKRLNTVLFNLVETIRFIGVLLQPFMPKTAEDILKQIKAHNHCFGSISKFGLYANIEPLDKPIPLFQRIDPILKMKEVEIVEEINYASIEDFAKIEIKIGEIKECIKHPKADKLLVSKIDTGSIRQVVSGIAHHYQPSQMIGKKVLVVTNLKPVEIRGILSEGMILVGGNKEALEVIEVTTLNAGDIVK